MHVSFDYYKQLESPVMYLCSPNKKYITAIDANDRHLILRFNDISELSFSVTYGDKTRQYYNLIETKRLVFIEGIGWFQITSVQEDDSGTNKAKSVTAQSHQYSLKDRGFVSENRVYMFYNPLDPCDSKYDSSDLSAIPSIVGQLYKQLGFKLDLTYNEDEKGDAANWTITYINKSLYFCAASDGLMYTPDVSKTNICRTMDEDLESNGYDFIRNKVQEGFEVIFEFDFLYHTVKIKTLEEITSPTNIYLSFDNVINTISVSEKAEDIVTVMSCSGGDGLDIRTVNPMGTNYIVNFEYYKKEKSENGELDYPWLSKEAIETLNSWEETFNSWQSDDENREGHKKGFTTIVKDLQEKYIPYNELNTDITNYNLKLLDLQTVKDQYVSEEIKGDEILTAETWEIGEKSLCENSIFYSKPFSDDISITGYTSAPEYVNGNFEFSSSASGKTGAINEMILNYIEDGEEGNPIYLYFIDVVDVSDKKSYCKLLVSSEVGIVKNVDGNIDENGTVKFDTAVFTVETSTDSFKITTEKSGVIVVNKSDPYYNYDGKRYKITESADKVVTIYYYYVSGFTRFTTCSQVKTWYSLWENYISSVSGSIDEIKLEIDALEAELSYITEQCNIETFFKNKGEALYEELSYYWIEGEYENDQISVSDSTTMSERIDLAKELMEAGEKDLAKNSQPQFEMTVNSINFAKLFEFKQFTDQLELGRTITIEKDDNTYYRPALLSIEYDLDGTDDFSLTFSNAVSPTNTTMTIADLLNETSSTSRKVSANWSNLTAYANDKEELYSIIINPLDSALKSLKKDMVDQEVIIDSSGYLGRKKVDASDGSGINFSPEQIRIINNIIMFTDDGWETASLALGKTEYGYGLVADVLVGELILGQKISIGSNSERVTINDDGIIIKNDDGENVFMANEHGDLTIKGTIYATDGKFEGEITASAGVIGGFKITSSSLCKYKDSFEDQNSDGVYIGEDGVSLGKGMFSIKQNGEAIAKNISLLGTYSKTTVSENGLNISSTKLANSTCEICSAGLYIRADDQTFTAPTDMIFGILSKDGTIGDSNYANTRGLYINQNGNVNLHTLGNADIMIVSDGNQKDGDEAKGSLYLLANKDVEIQANGKILLNGAEYNPSDKRLKTEINSIDAAISNMFDELTPCRYKFINNKEYLRFGFIAQEVAELVKKYIPGETALYHIYQDNLGQETYALNYKDFIALNTNEIHKLKHLVNKIISELDVIKRVLKLS